MLCFIVLLHQAAAFAPGFGCGVDHTHTLEVTKEHPSHPEHPDAGRRLNSWKSASDAVADGTARGIRVVFRWDLVEGNSSHADPNMCTSVGQVVTPKPGMNLVCTEEVRFGTTFQL